MAPHSNRSALLPALVLGLFGAACTSTSEFGLVLQPQTTATLEVLGDNPLVTVENAGPWPIDVSFAPRVGSPDAMRALLGSAACTLRGGGELRLVLVEGSGASVRVCVERSTGADLRIRTAAR